MLSSSGVSGVCAGHLIQHTHTASSTVAYSHDIEQRRMCSGPMKHGYCFPVIIIDFILQFLLRKAASLKFKLSSDIYSYENKGKPKIYEAKIVLLVYCRNNILMQIFLLLIHHKFLGHPFTRLSGLMSLDSRMTRCPTCGPHLIYQDKYPIFWLALVNFDFTRTDVEW